MSITLYDDWEARPTSATAGGKITSTEVGYKLYGVASEQAAVVAASIRLPRYVDGLRLADLSVAGRIGKDGWRIRARYQYRDSGNGSRWGEPKTGFRVGSTSTTRQEAIRRVAVAGDAPDAVRNGLAIDIDDQGNARGVSVPVGNTTYYEKYWVPAEDLTPQYVVKVNDLVGSVNDRQFRGFAAQTLRFDGLEFEKRPSDEEVEVSFNFNLSPGGRIESVGGKWTLIKQGWQYLWVKFKKTAGVTGFLPEAEYAVVDQVLPEVNFGQLGIGI